MKNLPTIFSFVLIIFISSFTSAQEKTEWIRIESGDKELSFAFPSNILIDATTKSRNQQYRLFGFENGVLMEMKITKPDNPKKQLDQIKIEAIENVKLNSFIFEGIPGKHIISNKTRYYNTIYLALKDSFYTFSINAPDENENYITRFFCSINIKGKPLFVCEKPPLESNNKTVLLSSLQTSSKVLEALSRKDENKKGKVTYASEGKEEEDITNKNSSRQPAIILHNELPKPRVISKIVLHKQLPGVTSTDSQTFTGKFTIKLKATLLASGQIGDITVYSRFDKSNLENYVEAVRKTKFIPAQVDGKPVDSEYMFVYVVEST